MKVLFTGALLDSSGYAEASRNYLGALSLIPGIELQARAVSFENFKTEHTQYNQLLKKYMSNRIKPEIQIIHLTPENFAKLKISGIKNIGLTVWETSRLPNEWVKMCNQMDEIWVPCDWNVDVFKSSGVIVPVKKIPHTIDFAALQPIQSYDLGIPSTGYKFYSIFQWSARKNPEGLIRSYYAEFNNTDNVCLVLKTYLQNNSESDKQQIKTLIKNIKNDLFLTDTPPIVLIHGSLSRDQILDLHRQCDCFVLPHRAEGWGVPHFEAMAQGKPVIATGYGGNLEFMSPGNSVITGFSMTPVCGMGRPTYNGKMEWAEPNLGEFRTAMKSVYQENNSSKYSEKAISRTKQFSWENVSKLIQELL